MIVYVESNFVLEIALGQEEISEAGRILQLAENKAIELVIPSLAIYEPYSTLDKRSKDRQNMVQRMIDTSNDLKRNQNLGAIAQEMFAAAASLATMDRRELDKLNEIVEKILDIAKIIESNSSIIRNSAGYQAQYDLQPKDSIIFASCIFDMQLRDSAERKCFVNRNRNDFKNKLILDLLHGYSCRFEGNFRDGLAYISPKTP